jgi:hypothetical protein
MSKSPESGCEYPRGSHIEEILADQLVASLDTADLDPRLLAKIEASIDLSMLPPTEVEAVQAPIAGLNKLSIGEICERQARCVTALARAAIL